jgi:hypothetical protein
MQPFLISYCMQDPTLDCSFIQKKNFPYYINCTHFQFFSSFKLVFIFILAVLHY